MIQMALVLSSSPALDLDYMAPAMRAVKRARSLGILLDSVFVTEVERSLREFEESFATPFSVYCGHDLAVDAGTVRSVADSVRRSSSIATTSSNAPASPSGFAVSATSAQGAVIAGSPMAAAGTAAGSGADAGCSPILQALRTMELGCLGQLLFTTERLLTAHSQSCSRGAAVYSSLSDQISDLRTIEQDVVSLYYDRIGGRASMEGYLYLRRAVGMSGKDSKTTKNRARWLRIVNESLLIEHPDSRTIEKTLSLQVCTVRVERELPLVFEVVSPQMQFPLVLTADSEALRTQWVNALRAGIERGLTKGSSGTGLEATLAAVVTVPAAVSSVHSSAPVSQNQGPVPSSPLSNSATGLIAPSSTTVDTGDGVGGLHPSGPGALLSPPGMSTASVCTAASAAATESPPEVELTYSGDAVLRLLNSVRGNTRCADCLTASPTWASINLGVMICLECSGVHRSLGTHVTKVRSATLDDWDPEVLRMFVFCGNRRVNRVLEYKIPLSLRTGSLFARRRLLRGSPNGLASEAELDSLVVTRSEREEWIREKYARKTFMRKRKRSIQAAVDLLFPSASSHRGSVSHDPLRDTSGSDSDGSSVVAAGAGGLMRENSGALSSEGDDEDDELLDLQPSPRGSPRPIMSPLLAHQSRRFMSFYRLVLRLRDINELLPERDHGTLLHAAVCSDLRVAVIFLVLNGADVAAQDDREWSPLHYAAFLRRTMAAHTLMGTDPRLHMRVDLRGRKPAQVAELAQECAPIADMCPVLATQLGTQGAVHPARCRCRVSLGALLDGVVGPALQPAAALPPADQLELARARRQLRESVLGVSVPSPGGSVSGSPVSSGNLSASRGSSPSRVQRMAKTSGSVIAKRSPPLSNSIAGSDSATRREPPPLPARSDLALSASATEKREGRQPLKKSVSFKNKNEVVQGKKKMYFE